MYIVSDYVSNKVNSDQYGIFKKEYYEDTTTFIRTHFKL